MCRTVLLLASLVLGLQTLAAGADWSQQVPQEEKNPPINPVSYPAADQLGRICYCDEELSPIGEYRITPEDAEFLARVIDGETWGNPSYDDASMMLWTLAQRKRIGKFPRWSLKELAEAYSQPINPIWLRDGRMCRAFYPDGQKFQGDLDDYVDGFVDGLDESDYHANGLEKNWSKETAKKKLRNRWQACVEENVDRRHHNIYERSWTDLAPLAREMTLIWASGRVPLKGAGGNLLPRRPGSIGWFAPNTWETSQEGRTRVDSVDNNVYYANETWAKSDHWTDEMTTVVSFDSMCPDYLNASSPLARREIAVTFDDVPLGGRVLEVERIQAVTEKLLASITGNEVPAIGFVSEGKLYQLGELDELTAVLRRWVDAGLELGNHTFSHPSLQVTSVAAFKEDVIRGETITKKLLAEAGMTLRYFRHPFLLTGPSLAVRADFEGFLDERGYTVAPVTIENSDWLFAAVYADARKRGDRSTMQRVGDAYLDYTRAEFDFWEKVSVELLGYQVKHVLLLHVNELNADYFDDLVGLMQGRGYSFIALEEALGDPAYELADTYAGPAGVSWLYRWAHSKRVEINWGEEPERPAFVVELFNSPQ